MSSKKIVLIAAFILFIASFPAISQACSPVDQVISSPFTYDGSGDFCWEVTCLGDYINCWNLDLMTINGVDFTNGYVAPSQYPATVNGVYYIRYVGNYPWSHIELVGSCGTAPTNPPDTPAPTAAPTTPPSQTAVPGVGDVSMVPNSVSGSVGSNVSFDIDVNSGSQRVAAYGIDITYNSGILGYVDCVAGSQGFVSAVNANDPGIIRTSGFDATGTGPSSSLNLLIITLRANSSGTSSIGISVDTLADDATNTIGNPRGVGGTITVESGVTAAPTATPVATNPPTTPAPGVGDVSMSPASISVGVNDSVSFSIMVNSGTQRVAAYGIDISYNAGVLGNPSVAAGADGFVSATNTNTAGQIITSGFDATGTGPGNNLELLRVTMTATGSGTSSIGITVNQLVDESTNTIGSPNGIGGTITVSGTVTAAPTNPPQITNPPTGDLEVLNQSQMSVTYVDSEELSGEDGAGSNAIDGNTGTIWHTEWQDSSPSHPHEIRISLGGTYNVGGLRYLPRQDSNLNGTIAGYQIYVGSTQVASGTWANSNAEKEVQFNATSGSSIRLVATSEVSGNEWTSAAEINVLVSSGGVTAAPTATPIATNPPTTPAPGVGDVSMSPASISASVNDSVSFSIMVNSGSQRVAAYGIDISYNSGVLGNPSVAAGADGFVSATNTNTPGQIITSGFDATGTGPGNNLELLRVTMTATGSGTSSIGITVNQLVDESTNTIGDPNGIGGTITVSGTITAAPTAPPQITDPPTGELTLLNQSQLSVTYVDSEELSGEDGAGSNAIDGNTSTIWHTEWQNSSPSHPHEIRISLGGTYNVGGLRYLPRQTSTLNGTIAQYEIYVGSSRVASGTWASNNAEKEVQFGSTSGNSIRLVALSEINGNPWTSAAEINVLVYSGSATAAPTAVPTATPVITAVPTAVPTNPPTGELPWTETFDSEPGGRFSINRETRTWSSSTINISGVSNVSISAEIEGDNASVMESSDYLNLYYSINGGSRIAWSQNTDGFTLRTVSVDGLSGNTLVVSLEGYTSYSDETYYVDNIVVSGSGVVPTAVPTATPVVTAAPTNPPQITDPPTGELTELNQSQMSVTYVDSEELQGEDGAGDNAIDGNTSTIWHTEWQNSSPSHPHEIQISLGGTYNVGGLRYLPRQDSNLNGTIAGYQVYVGSTQVASGTWANSNSEKEVQFNATSGSSIRLVATSEVNGNEWTSAAEINVLVYDGSAPTAAPTATPATTAVPTATPAVTAAPTATPVTGAGSVSMSPSSINATVGDSISFSIMVNSGNQRVAAYGIDISYNSGILGNPSVSAGSDGFVSAINTNDPGVIVTSGFDATGTGPGTNLELLIITIDAQGSGTSSIGITVNQLVDENTTTIGNPNGSGGTVVVQGQVTAAPTAVPTTAPTAVPTAAPTATPVPTATPAITDAPTAVPTTAPTAVPTAVPTAAPTATPVATAVPTATPAQVSAGSVWLEPSSQSVSNGSTAPTEVHCHTGSQNIAAYGIDFYYNSGILSVASGDVSAGSDGFVSAINANEAGKLVTSGFDATGRGPGTDLHLLTINWHAAGRGTSAIDLDVRSFVDSNTTVVGNPSGISGSVTVN